MLREVKALLGIDRYNTDHDEQIEACIKAAALDAAVFCNLDETDELPDGLKNTVIQMAVIKYNRIGTEGLVSESYAGASYSYSDTYPDSVMTALKRHRRLRAI